MKKKAQIQLVTFSKIQNYIKKERKVNTYYYLKEITKETEIKQCRKIKKNNQCEKWIRYLEATEI